jgi:hypothetical protein
MPKSGKKCSHCGSSNVKPRVVLRGVYLDCADCGVTSHRTEMTAEYNRRHALHITDVRKQWAEGR